MTINTLDAQAGGERFPTPIGNLPLPEERGNDLTRQISKALATFSPECLSQPGLTTIRQQIEDAVAQKLPRPTAKHQAALATLADYALIAKEHGRNLHAAYFRQIIDALIYELFFPRELKTVRKDVLRHLGDLTPIAASMSKEEKLAIIDREFYRLYDLYHPVRNNVETLDSVIVVHAIREKLRR